MTNQSDNETKKLNVIVDLIAHRGYQQAREDDGMYTVKDGGAEMAKDHYKRELLAWRDQAVREAVKEFADKLSHKFEATAARFGEVSSSDLEKYEDAMQFACGVVDDSLYNTLTPKPKGDSNE